MQTVDRCAGYLYNTQTRECVLSSATMPVAESCQKRNRTKYYIRKRFAGDWFFVFVDIYADTDQFLAMLRCGVNYSRFKVALGEECLQHACMDHLQV